MRNLTYLDFDLAIERSNDRYRARIVNSPTGQASTEFTSPFSDLEVENFVLRVGQTRRQVRRFESSQMEMVRQFGQRLFDAVFTDEVRGRLRSSLNEVQRQNAGLRIRLHLADAPELTNLPWEYLYDSSLDQFLALSVETPVVRYMELSEGVRPLAMAAPLRVLVMISSPQDCPPLNVEQEWQKLEQALHELGGRNLIVLERLPNASLSALQKQLRRNDYHVFHFIGHGGFSEQAQDGLLVLTDERGSSHPISGHDLGVILHDVRSLRLAVLNACEGARVGASDPFAGVAQSLMRCGIPSVIAMQFEVTDNAAILFTREFYGAVADGYPLDAALAESRKALFASGNDVEWGTPVLYLRAPDGCIFDIAQHDKPAAEPAPSLVTPIAQTAAPPSSDSKEAASAADAAALYDGAVGKVSQQNWAEARHLLLQLRDRRPGYRDVERLLARTEGELARQEEDARIRQRADLLYAQAQGFADAGRWEEVLQKLNDLRSLDASYRDCDDLEQRARQSLAQRTAAAAGRAVALSKQVGGVQAASQPPGAVTKHSVGQIDRLVETPKDLQLKEEAVEIGGRVLDMSGVMVWFLFTVLGSAFGSLTSAIAPTEEYAVIFVFLGMGVGMGIAQYLVLRKRFRGAFQWVILTSVAGAISAMLLVVGLFGSEYVFMLMLIFLFCNGLAMGLFQTFFLARRVNWWLLWPVITLFAGVAAAYYGERIVSSLYFSNFSSDRPQARVEVFMMFGVIYGSIYGLITALNLALMTRKHA